MRATMLGEPAADTGHLLPFYPMDPTNRPEPFKRYRAGGAAVPLPAELRRSSRRALDVLSGHRGDPTPVDEDLLGTLLFLAGGVTRVAHTPDGEPIWFRTAMSAGNLHPVEIYVVGGRVFHYEPLAHTLTPISDGDGALDGSGVTLVLTGIPFRTCWKYGERGWRHLWWDAGCLLANLLAAADAHGVPVEVSVAFDDDGTGQLLGIDGVDEVPLAVVTLGSPVRRTEPPRPIVAVADPPAPRPLRFPLVVDAQRASTLGADEVEPWRSAAAALSRRAPAAVSRPTGVNQEDTVEDVILRRGSTRMFVRTRVPSMLLRWGLAAATRAAPLDSGSLVEHLVNVHGIEDLEPGGYRYQGGTRYEGRTRTPDVRAFSARLCLDQPLAGDSAYTVFHTADLTALAAQLGPRAYRAALLEAGLVSGRLALNAVATGAGATGLTFYDPLVRSYFRTEATPLLATAVGVPATTAAPSGRPGTPIELRRYPTLMARLAAQLDERLRFH